MIRAALQEGDVTKPVDPPTGPSLVDDNEGLARDYEAVSVGRQFVSGRRLVEALAIAPGERVLDVGCGTGLLAEHIAAIVGPAGHVLGIDPLPLRVQMARDKARDRGLVNAEFRVEDANDLSSIATASFDVVFLNAVFHWLPDKTGPLRNFARVLRGQGRIGIAGTAKDRNSPMREVMAEILTQPPFSAYVRAGAYAWRVDETEMRALLDAAGFEVTRIELYEVPHIHASAEAAVRYAEASSFGNLLSHLPMELRPAARAAMVRTLPEIAAADGTIVEDGRRMIAIAVKPHGL
jgi:arsenite methyltransferase